MTGVSAEHVTAAAVSGPDPRPVQRLQQNLPPIRWNPPIRKTGSVAMTAHLSNEAPRRMSCEWGSL